MGGVIVVVVVAVVVTTWTDVDGRRRTGCGSYGRSLKVLLDKCFGLSISFLSTPRACCFDSSIQVTSIVSPLW